MNLYGKTILVICLMYSTHSVYCQDMSFGYVTSISLPGYSGSGWDSYLEEQDADNNPIVGAGLGLTGEFPVNRHFSLRTDLLFSAVGGGYVEENPEGEDQASLISEINLDLPLMIKWSFLSTEKISFYAMGGYQMSFLLSQSQYSQEGPVFDKEGRSRSSFNPVGWGGTGGIGMEVFTANQFIYVEVRYLREFNSSFRDYGSVYQNNLSFSTGMRWESKKR